MAASVPAPSCKGARQLDGREKRCGRRMGGDIAFPFFAENLPILS